MFRVPLLPTASFLLLILLSGCPSSPPQGNSRAGGPSQGTAGEETKSKPELQELAADDVAGNVQRVLDGLEQKRLRAVWDFLPKSFQQDLQSLVREFGAKMDPEIWSRTMSIVKRAARILREKEGWMQTPAANTPTKPGQSRQPKLVDYKGIAKLLEGIADGELGDLQKLSRIELSEWCDSTGNQLLEQLQIFSEQMPADPLAKTLTGLKWLTIKAEPAKGDSAVIFISTPLNETLEVPYQRIEGKWIPTDLANGWIESIGEARARLAVTLNPENLEPVKPRILVALSVLDDWLASLESAKSKDDFDFAWAQGLQNAFSVAASFSPSLQDEGEPESEPTEMAAGPVVSIRVKGELSFARQDELLEQLAKLTDDGTGAFREISASRTETTFVIGPVADVAAFATKIDALQVSKVDAASRTILAVPLSN